VKPSSAPVADTGSVDSTTSSATILMGAVDPGGAATTYYFEYGTSVDYGQTTAAKNAGSGSAQVAVTLKLSGLSPGQTYYYRLVAKNSVGTSYGQGATFQTTSPPSAVTGTATTVTASSEMLSGTVDPGGLETSYYFEWGRTASFGERTASQDAGAASAAASVSRLATGLQPDATYIFRLVAKSSLGTSFGTPVTFETAESSCLAETQVISEDAQGLKTAKDALSADQLGAGASVTTDEQTLSSDEQSLAAAQQALSADESRAMNPNTTFTAIPATGQILSRGSNVYSLDGLPVPLFYGTVIPDRALYLGVADGPDVTQLQANLIALGFGSGISATAHFSSATEQAVKTWQASLGVPATGVVALGDFVLEPGPIEVDTVSASLGETAAQPGSSVLTATSTSRVVTIALDAAQQSEVKVGDPVTITLPNNNTTPGVVSSVGTVATSSSSGAGNTGGGGSSSTITVVVTPTDPSATGAYDQAPVEVSITNASVASALVVPVDALLALSGGGYALEEIGKGKVHHLVPVSLGLFDDADGLVQVSGPGVAAGQRVVVPAL
jgi:peptidoglycan hydrolase-like protein with peptidoglycan-binding domain